jgi:hypothetical protein
LYEHALARGEGELAAEGPMVCKTGAHTGRSPNDKFIVREPSSEANVAWGKVNKGIDAGHFDALKRDMLAHLSNKPLYIQDLSVVAADPDAVSVGVYVEHRVLPELDRLRTGPRVHRQEDVPGLPHGRSALVLGHAVHRDRRQDDSDRDDDEHLHDREAGAVPHLCALEVGERKVTRRRFAKTMPGAETTMLAPFLRVLHTRSRARHCRFRKKLSLDARVRAEP